MLDFNGDLKSAKRDYRAASSSPIKAARARWRRSSMRRRKLEIDGAEVKPEIAGNVLILPRGQHLVTLAK